MGLVDVHCRALGATRTEVTVMYTLTPLSQEGEKLVAEMLEPARYRAFIDGWKTLIDDARAPAA